MGVARARGRRRDRSDAAAAGGARRRRGRARRASRLEPCGAGAAHRRRSSVPGSRRERCRRSPSTSPRPSSLLPRPLPVRDARTATLDVGGARRRARGLVSRLPDRVDRGSARRGRLGGLARRHPAPRASVQLLGDDLFVTAAAASARRRSERRGERGAREAEPGGHAEPCRRGRRARPSGGLRDRGLGALRATPRTPGSPTSPSAGAPARSRSVRPTRSERTAKWNRLLRIEAREPAARYAGASALQTRSAKELL